MRLFALIPLLALLGSPLAQATIIASDSFNGYTVGASLTGANGGSGWTSAWSTTDGSNNYTAKVVSGSIPGAGNSAGLGASGGGVNDNQDAFERTFPTQNDPSTDLYVGLTLRTTGPLDDGDFLQFYFNPDLGSSNTSGVSAGLRNTAGNPYFVRKGSSSATTESSLDHVNDTVVRLVIRLGKSGSLVSDPWNEVALFVNQANEGTPDANRGSGAGGNGATSDIGAFHVRMFSFEGGQNAFIDDIQIATTYAEAATVIPEPSTLALLLAGALGGFMRYRRLK